MKLTRSKTSPRRPLRPRKIFARLIRVVAAILAGLTIAVVIAIILSPAGLQRAVAGFEQRWGQTFFSFDRPFAEKMSILVGGFLRQAGDENLEIPQLVIDVPFAGMQKIFEKREEALRAGKLVQGEDDFVKGEIRADGRTVPIKLRLKGDWNDHLTGRKWSFRIHVRQGEHLYGMRRFSVQAPLTRDFQAELLFFEAAKRFGVMTPRYEFVEVTLNGDSMGVMALEESFGKELLEYNRRREGVIVRFDESMVWDAKDSAWGENVGWEGAFDHFRNAAVDGFESGRIAESPVLAKQYKVAVGLLRGFVAQELKASVVFDVEQLGRLIAVADLFGTWHAVAWHNMRFYLNPITLKLEPIAYDATLQRAFRNKQSVLNDDPFMQQVIQDPAVFKVYQRTLGELAELMESGELMTEIREAEEVPLQILKTEFRLLTEFPLDHLGPRIEDLVARYGSGDAVPAAEVFQFASIEQNIYPILARARILGDSTTLEITNVVPKEIEVVGLEWVNADNDERVAIAIDTLPIVMPARGIGAMPRRWLIDFGAAPPTGVWNLQTVVRFRDRPWVRRVTAFNSYPPLKDEPIPPGTVATLREQHAFLTIDEAAASVTMPAGTHTVLESLVIPEGFRLNVAAGANLQFAPAAVLIVHGALRIEGTAAAPVVFTGINAGRWPGLVVLNAPERSRLEYLTVRDTSAVIMANWTLTGGVNFYASDVDILNSRFEESHGEDALNIIHSEFVIRDSVIEGTASDAFDADFSNGTVTGSQFLAVGRAGGGDAVDVSGSSITVSSSRFVDISDKALSVGERSEMVADNIDMQGVGTGAAAKDASVLTLSNVRIADASFAGLTAYIKKPEYGPARIEATGVQITGTERLALVQTNSEVVLDGAAIETEDVDVDALYETVMRKGLK